MLTKVLWGAAFENIDQKDEEVVEVRSTHRHPLYRELDIYGSTVVGKGKEGGQRGLRVFTVYAISCVPF